MFNKLPSELKKELNRLAFKGSHKNMTELFLNEDAKTIFDLINENENLLNSLRELSLNENATFFRTVLFKIGHNPKSLKAILNGFKADEAFNTSHDTDERFGASANPKDLEEKRAALREFSLDQNAKEKNNEKNNERQRIRNFPER